MAQCNCGKKIDDGIRIGNTGFGRSGVQVRLFSLETLIE
jgi:hypothetical protein